MSSRTRKGRRRKLPPNTKVQATADVSLARWDQGAMGPANRQGLVTEPRGDIDPDTGKVRTHNNVKGVRRVDMLEVYFDRGWISDRGYTAGEKLRDAWEATQKGKGQSMGGVKVDRTPKPDAAIDIQIDRVSRLVLVSRHVPDSDAAIIFAVACEGRSIGHLREYRGRKHETGKAHLHSALERLATAMGG